MISAFVPTLNNELTIRRVIQSLKVQTIKPKKIIVIDSGSTDNTKKIALEEGAEFYSPKDFGFEFLGLGKARNRILECIDTPYLLSVDSDILLQPNHIEKLLPKFEADPMIAGVAGKQIELNRIHVGDKARALVDGKDLVEPIESQNEMFRNFIMGSNNIYDVNKLKEVGEKFNQNPCRPFRDELTSNYEDVDIGMKLRSCGYKLLWTPEVLTFHLQKDDLSTFINRAYRYKLFEWKINNAFENHEIYEERITQTFEYVQRGFEIAYKKSRAYLTYPFLLIGFHFFVEDISLFKESKNLEFAQKIYNSVIKSLQYFKSEKLKRGIYNYIQSSLESHGFKYDENSIDDKLFSWFKSLTSLEILDSKFPAIHDFKIDKVDLLTQTKVVESSLNRIEKEQELNIYDSFRVLLLNPTWKVDGRYGVRAGSRWPHTQIIYNEASIPRYIPYPFFLSHTFSLLQENNIGSWILDAVAEGYNEDECFYESIGYEPDLIVLENSTPSFEVDLRWAKMLKKALPKSKICMVGPHVSHEKESSLSKEYIDFAIDGEYEQAVFELSLALKNNTSYEQIEGLIYRKYDKTILNGKTKKVDFNALPTPIRDIMPIYNYNDRTIQKLLYPSLQVQLSRGCPYKCTFCLWPQVMFNSNYQLANIEKVVDSIQEGIAKFGMKSFYVDDDTFNIDKKHIINFANLLIKRGINIPWMAMSRADTIVDEESLKVLKQSGLVALKFGIESVDEVVLEEMKKNLDVKKCEETIALCKKLGIEVHLTFSIGYFSDTIDRIAKSFKWLISQNPDSQQLSIVTPFPSTAMYQEVKNRGFNPENDFSKYDGARFTVVTSAIKKEHLESIKQEWIEQWNSFKSTGKYNMGFLNK